MYVKISVLSIARSRYLSTYDALEKTIGIIMQRRVA